MYKREQKIRRLISNASTDRLNKLIDKCGPLADDALEELYLRNLYKKDLRAAEALGVVPDGYYDYQ